MFYYTLLANNLQDQFFKSSFLQLSCKLSKQHSYVHFNRNKPCSACHLFVLLHVDIWGHCPNICLHGYRYFPTMVDECIFHLDLCYL